MNRYLRIRLLVIGAVAIVAGSVWLAGNRQRSTADRAFSEAQAADEMLVAMIDQETGFFGYLATGQTVLLRRYQDARQRFDQALVAAQGGAEEGETDELEAIALQRRIAGAWRSEAETLLGAALTGRRRVAPTATQARLRQQLERFRTVNAAFKEDLREERIANQASANNLSVALIVVLSFLFAALGYLLFERRARGDDRRRRLHARFSDVLQLARSEEEAYAVVKRYLEQLVPGGRATVLNRNSSANRLEARTPIENPDLRLKLETVEPEACMAIRSGKTYQRRSNGDELMTCAVCGALGDEVTCVPSLVGGEVVGSVLVEHPHGLPTEETEQLSTGIAESAPVISNLRNLAIAQMRASTDALTGLPNQRAVQTALKRMTARALTTDQQLAALMIDLDHFKQINDTCGHAKGDQVLAMVGHAATATIRGGDFAGRYGGEEFVVLLPETDLEHGVMVAENLRAAIAAIEVSGVERGITASVGVAVLPGDATEPDQLLRGADRALYTAKAHGRNRVEVLATDRAPAPLGPPRLAATPE